MLPKHYDNLNSYLDLGKVLVIFGPRQVGKTTLLEDFLSKTGKRVLLVSGDDIRVQDVLGSQDLRRLMDFVSGYDVLAIDEAQRIRNIGMGLKLLVDHARDLQMIATGSSSFSLAGQIGEPLTGRKRVITLYPLSQLELSGMFNAHEMKQRLEKDLVFGTYPEVVTARSDRDRIAVLEELVSSYLLKDILEVERVKGAKVLLDLLRLLAYQVGEQVSHHELATRLGIDTKTVARYLDLLEKAFVLYNLRGYAKNLRKEIVRKSKYYFLDLGIRNGIIRNFNELDHRNDQGKLWENFLVMERLKYQAYVRRSANNFFWRTWEGHELDWLEERDGTLFAYEFKWSPQRVRFPKPFLQSYEGTSIEVITRENYLAFIGVKTSAE